MFAVCRSHYLLSGRRKKAHTKAAGRKTKKRQGRGKKRGVRRSKVGTGTPNQQEGPILEGVGGSLVRGDGVGSLPPRGLSIPCPPFHCCKKTCALSGHSSALLVPCPVQLFTSPGAGAGVAYTGVLESLRWCREGLHSLALLCHRTKSQPAAALPARWGSADRPVAPVSQLCTSPPGHPSA